MKQQKRGPWLALVALVAAVAVCGAIYWNLRPQGAAGEKSIMVEVIHGDGSTREFPLVTGQEFLGRALVENQVAEDNQGPYGLYLLTVDGETADEAKQEWWCITRDGESLTTGADVTPLADGERYELTFTVGYDS